MGSNTTQYVRKHIVELASYTPIVPFEVLSEQLGRAPEDIVKLDANENPYGPPPGIHRALIPRLSSLRAPNSFPQMDVTMIANHCEENFRVARSLHLWRTRLRRR
jgi:histidinol-phosphate aminotransferase